MEIDKNSTQKFQSRNPLASLWNNLYGVLQIRKPEWERRLNNYLDTPGNENVTTDKNRATTKNRLTSQIGKDTISMNTFTKALRIAGFTRGTLIFRGWRGRSANPIEAHCNFIINDSSRQPIEGFELDDDNDEFFISTAHRYAYMLTDMTSLSTVGGPYTLALLLGFSEKHDTKPKINAWYKDVLKQLNTGDLSNDTKNLAAEKLKQIYDIMTDSEK